MKPKKESSLLTSVSLLAYRTIEKSKFSVVRHHTWLLKSFLRSSTQALQPIFGHVESYCMLSSVVSSHSEGKTTRSFTQTYAHRSSNSRITYRHKRGTSWISCSTRHLKDVYQPSKSSKTAGLRLVLRSMRCSARPTCMACPNRQPRKTILTKLREYSRAYLGAECLLRATLILWWSIHQTLSSLEVWPTRKKTSV